MTNSAVALVTGANKGIGREIARGLAQLGLTVLASSRDEQRGERAVAELAAEGLDVRPLRLDVTDEQSVAAAARRISDEFGRLDVLVNNAGITVDRSTTPSTTTTDAMRTVYETNVFGVVTVTRAMLPLLRRSPAGRIVNLSSGLGSLERLLAPDSTLPLFLAYNSSKSALNAVTVHYARELRDTPIKVNVCAPGLCATDINDHKGDRTAAQGARIAVELATLDSDGPTAGFFDDHGPVPW
ncbi:SDR family oxidoreductase [Peterkaempfera bronchialis]|uniref:SDR family oxidoreductase n=1 Tax=Peterkaempfera bronchialis TaxID=2126346 RepID=A0A345T4H0_9ACTN|nr:SDR family oxidoreductase [Peterkaempfera bronchialis]AXI80875.1 SDR family oxidoreductase [Peterkaempfera bronchialis]